MPHLRAERGTRFDEEVGDGFAADEVLLDDALKVFGSAGVIPGGVRIDNGDGATGANAEAVGFGSLNK